MGKREGTGDQPAHVGLVPDLPGAAQLGQEVADDRSFCGPGDDF